MTLKFVEEFLPKLFIVSDVSLVDDQTAVFDGEDVFTKIYSANGKLTTSIMLFVTIIV